MNPLPCPHSTHQNCQDQGHYRVDCVYLHSHPNHPSLARVELSPVLVTKLNCSPKGTVLEAYRASDEPIFVAVLTPCHFVGLRDDLAAAAAFRAGHKTHPAAAITGLADVNDGEVSQKLPQLSVLMEPTNFVRPADVSSLDENAGDDNGAPDELLELKTKLGVHGHVALVHPHREALQNHAQAVAILERLPDAAQGRQIQHHPVVTARRTLLLVLGQGVQNRPEPRLLWVLRRGNLGKIHATRAIRSGLRILSTAVANVGRGPKLPLAARPRTFVVRGAARRRCLSVAAPDVSPIVVG